MVTEGERFLWQGRDRAACSNLLMGKRGTYNRISGKLREQGTEVMEGKYAMGERTKDGIRTTDSCLTFSHKVLI